MKSLMAVIDKLDIRRAQVQVQAIIVEVDVNKSSNIGVQWLLDGGNNYGYGVTNLPGSGTSIVDLAAAVARRLRQYHHAPPPRYDLESQQSPRLAPAPRSHSASTTEHRQGFRRAHSGPAQRRHQQHHLHALLITMNNEEAEVKVTQEIPLITGSYTSSTATSAARPVRSRPFSARKWARF